MGDTKTNKPPCRHNRVIVHFWEDRYGNGYHGEATCADCGKDIDVVEIY